MWSTLLAPLAIYDLNKKIKVLERQSDNNLNGKLDLMEAADDVFGYACDPRMIRRTQGEVIGIGLAALLGASTRATQSTTQYELISNAQAMLANEDVRQACRKYTVDLSDGIEIWLPTMTAETLDVQDLELMGKLYAVRRNLSAHALEVCQVQRDAYRQGQLQMAKDPRFTSPRVEGATPQIVHVMHAEAHLGRLKHAA